MRESWSALERTLHETAQGTVLCNESMSDHTTWRTGGTVRALVKPGSRDAFLETYQMLLNEGINFTILGAGSNVLWGDLPYQGVILTLDIAFNELEYEDDETVRVGAGVRLRRLMTEVHKKNYGGFSFLYGIPGTVGGAVRMNAGTRNGEVKDILVDAEVLSPKKITWKSNDACR